MRIGRTVPPAATPLCLKDILSGLRGMLQGDRAITRFRSELKEYFGVKHCFLLSSGKAALAVILEALHDLHPDRDEVLIPAYTCFSVPSAIVRAGLGVRLCDIGVDSFDFDHGKLIEMLTSASKSGSLLAVVPTHLFGSPADVDRIKTLLADPLVTIVEDAAQVMGSENGEEKLGTLGDVGFFSLGRGKAFSTVEGGVIVTDKEQIANAIGKRMKTVADHGPAKTAALIINALALNAFAHPTLFCFPKALPFLRLGETIYDTRFKIRKMSSFQAGLAHGWQNKLARLQCTRSINAGLWSKIIRSRLREGPTCLGLFPEDDVNSLCPVRFPLRIQNNDLRKRILKKSHEKGLGIMPGYPTPVDGIKALKGHFGNESFPTAGHCARELITLPVHPFVSDKDKRYISVWLSTLINETSCHPQTGANVQKTKEDRGRKRQTKGEGLRWRFS